ncbi:MAG: DNA polymerase IV, partial [Planctomycetota bacterium]
MTRAILHVDMDAFFAGVEVLDNPALKGKPVVVGGSPESHGVVAAASYEARAFGVRSAMPMATALRLCPEAVRVGARHGRYSEVSRAVFEILRRFTPLVEPVSVDEAYLDVTGSGRLLGDAGKIARRIKRAVAGEVGLTCSIGVATTKLVAKIASDFNKPDGLTVVEPGHEADFLAPMELRKLPGVGPKTAESLLEMGVRTLGELARYPADVLEERFGSIGPDLAARARGEDDSAVAGGGEPAKQISSETTLKDFTDDLNEIDRILLGLAEEVARRAREADLQSRTVTLKLRDDKFRTRTRAETLKRPTDMAREIAAAARALYRKNRPAKGRKVRLLGVALSKLAPAGSGQAELFVDESRERQRRAEKTVDAIRKAMGK